MAIQITAQELTAFAATLAGQELHTRTRHVPFSVRVTRGGLEFRPGSSGKPRTTGSGRLDQVLEEFAMSQSLRPGHYQALTVDASYILTLLARYLQHRGRPLPA